MKHAYLLYTGFGKTKMCLDKMMKASRKPRTLLISTKKVVESSWSSEITKWYPGKISYAYITGSVKEKDRQVLTNNQSQYDIFAMNTSMVDWYIKNTCSVKRKSYTKKGIKLHYASEEILDRFDLIIIDESSLFKNSQSQRFKDLKKWVYQANNVMILSATPTPKNIENIWSQIYLLDGGQRLGSSITKFREQWGIPVPLPNGHNKWQYSKAAINDILSLIQDITTSIPAPDKPLFPPPNLKKIMIKPDPTTEGILKQFKNDFIIDVQGKEIIAMTKNQLMIKVSQIASGSVYYKDQTLQLNDLKLRAIMHKISTIKTPVLIWYTYKFDKAKLLAIPGMRLLETPQDMLDWNANKIPLATMSPFSSAHGLNLQDSDCVNTYWFSPIWDTEIWIQANARVCRRGQKNTVNIGVLLVRGSYDEYMFNLCQDKFREQLNILGKLS